MRFRNQKSTVRLPLDRIRFFRAVAVVVAAAALLLLLLLLPSKYLHIGKSLLETSFTI